MDPSTPTICAHTSWRGRGEASVGELEVSFDARPGLLRFLRLAPARGYPRGLTLFMAAEYTLTRLRLADHRSDHLARALGRPPITLARFIHDHRAGDSPARANSPA